MPFKMILLWRLLNRHLLSFPKKSSGNGNWRLSSQNAYKMSILANFCNLTKETAQNAELRRKSWFFFNLTVLKEIVYSEL